MRGQIPGGHTKNLFLRDKKHALFLVVAEEDAEIDLKGLHRLLGASGRFSFGSSDLLREVWGVEPGAVTPFGAINDTAGRVTVVLDAAMMEHATLNFHPLVNTMTTSIARDDLVKLPGIDRPRPADRAGFRAGRRTPPNPIAFAGPDDPSNRAKSRIVAGEDKMLQNGGGTAAAAAADVVERTPPRKPS